MRVFKAEGRDEIKREKRRCHFGESEGLISWETEGHRRERRLENGIRNKDRDLDCP